MFSRGEITKKDKGCLCRMKMKEIMRIYSREVSGFERNSMLQR